MNPELRQHLQQAGAFIVSCFLSAGLAPGPLQHQPRCQPRNRDGPGRKYFVRMPIPARGSLLAATVHFFYAYRLRTGAVAIPLAILVA